MTVARRRRFTPFPASYPESWAKAPPSSILPRCQRRRSFAPSACACEELPDAELRLLSYDVTMLRIARAKE